jgi:UDP-N-acetylmuramyl pentapeptide phosphotransferase/UDP-N-acetylglucosamine-1-phosphate transferase
MSFCKSLKSKLVAFCIAFLTRKYVHHNWKCARPKLIWCQLSAYLSALLTLHTTTLLGIADDILDLRWRHKFFIPALAALPLLVVYYVDFGVTSVMIPRFLLSYIPNTSITNSESGLIHLGPLYYAYMAALSIFAPNSINILAGVNGIEVGQAIIVAALLMINSSLYLIPFPGNPILGAAPPPRDFPHPATDSHLFTIYLLLPFIAVSIALYSQNRYPARVFVGDTYCYFAGMVFAVVGILGHFSKTLLLLLIPQAINFIYSCPQLFKLVPCPRHRLPKYNARTNLLEPSVTEYPPERPPSKLQTAAFLLLAKLHLLEIEFDKETNRIKSTTNFTILNLWLVWFGPMREDRLTYALLWLQIGFGIIGLFVRHQMALWIFSLDNRGYGGSWEASLA